MTTMAMMMTMMMRINIKERPLDSSPVFNSFPETPEIYHCLICSFLLFPLNGICIVFLIFCRVMVQFDVDFKHFTVVSCTFYCWYNIYSNIISLQGNVSVRTILFLNDLYYKHLHIQQSDLHLSGQLWSLWHS